MVELKMKTYLTHEKMKAIVLGVLLATILMHSQGFCDGADPIDGVTKTVIQTIFSPWVKRSALAFGGGFGLFQSFASGSFKPLLTWGGLGLAVSYIPTLIETLSKIGG